jgi:diacylglycerol kinase family enzyme
MVAGALVGSGTPLGIVARGTSNSIAAGLGIPTDARGALETLVAGEVCAVDTARANGKPMILHASVGFHAATVAGTPRDAKNRWGVLAYIKEGLVNLAELEQFQVEIETENAIVRCRAVNVTVANVAPRKTVLAHGPAEISADDGALDVTIVAATGLAEVVATGLHLLRTATRAEPATRDNVGYLSARRLRIESEPAQALLIDGEPAGSGRLVVECLPRSLRVLLPRQRDVAQATQATPSAAEVSKLEGLPELEIEPKLAPAAGLKLEPSAELRDEPGAALRDESGAESRDESTRAPASRGGR